MTVAPEMMPQFLAIDPHPILSINSCLAGSKSNDSLHVTIAGYNYCASSQDQVSNS
jgi:hypothetical protein